jgi:hypothetical protein
VGCGAGPGTIGRSSHQDGQNQILLAVTGAGLSGVVVYIALGALAGVQEVRSTLSFVGKVREAVCALINAEKGHYPFSSALIVCVNNHRTYTYLTELFLYGT